MSNVVHVSLKNIDRGIAEKYILEKKADFKSCDDYTLNFSLKISSPNGDYTRGWMRKNWGSGSNGYDCEVKSGRDDKLTIDFNVDTAPPVEIIERMKNECDFEFLSVLSDALIARQITFINGVDRKTLTWEYGIMGDEIKPVSLHVSVKDENYRNIYHALHSMHPEKEYDDEYDVYASYTGGSADLLCKKIFECPDKSRINVMIPDFLISLNTKEKDSVQAFDKSEGMVYDMCVSDLAGRLGKVLTEDGFDETYRKEYAELVKQALSKVSATKNTI